MENEGKGGGKGAKKDGGGGGGGANAPMQCIMKFLTPEVLASAIIGKGGTVIAEMRKNYKAKLALSEHGEVYPGTDSRVFTASANEEESLTEVANELVAKIVEIAKGPAGAELINSSEGEMKLKVLVPRAAVGGIIGKGGNAVKQLRESTGAKISISDALGTGPGAEQLVSLTGTSEALQAVLKEINCQIQMLNGESWFATWASSNGAAAGGYSSLLGGGMPGDRWAGGKGMYSPGVDIMMRTAQSLPRYVMEDSRGFALSCVVPNRLVGGLIGRGGSGTKEVQVMTGTKIGIREIPGDSENRSMNIAGPLANTCAAYMLMMKRYLDAETSASASAPIG